MPNTVLKFAAFAAIYASLALAASPSFAEDMSSQAQQYQAQCNQAGGYFQYGTVNAPPNSDYTHVTNFKQGKKLKGIPLSHTHIEITSGIDQQIYDVAIDNVFAKDYNPHQSSVPNSYRQNIVAGSTLYFCGGNPNNEPYSLSEKVAQSGFDWVHTNCETPNSQFADGWLYTAAGVNLSNSQKYCNLWQ